GVLCVALAVPCHSGRLRVRVCHRPRSPRRLLVDRTARSCAARDRSPLPAGGDAAGSGGARGNAVEHRVRALNEPGSPNLVHDDEFARRLGFRSGLVPGVAVDGYMAELPARLWADRWLGNRTMSAWFPQPGLDGGQV